MVVFPTETLTWYTAVVRPCLRNHFLHATVRLFNMPLNNDIKRFGIRFFGLIFSNIFMASILRKLAPPFQQRLQPKFALCSSVVKRYTQHRDWLRIPSNIYQDRLQSSFTFVYWVALATCNPSLHLVSTQCPAKSTRADEMYLSSPSNSFSSPKYTLANEAARSIPLMIPTAFHTSPSFTHLRSRPNARYDSAVQIARGVLGLSCWTVRRGG